MGKLLEESHTIHERTIAIILQIRQKSIQYKQERRVKEADRVDLNLDLFFPV